MKKYIVDGLQIIATIIITGSAAYAMQPPANQELDSVGAANRHDGVLTSSDIKKFKANNTDKSKVEQAETKVVTWQDNPNNCDQSTQYIEENPPFNCIDKPTQQVAPSGRSLESPSGDCMSWIAQAGVPYSAAVEQLIIRESGCRPDAINPSSGACGIPQSLPCSKMPCTLQDPVCQIKWMDSYIRGRYNTWERAYAFWHCRGTCYNNFGAVIKTSDWY